MTFTEDEVISRVEGLSVEHLCFCIEEGWINPKQTKGQSYFAEIDIVRLQFILNLQTDLSIDAESMPIILSLIDQVHGLRDKLYSLANAVSEQPIDVQQAILRGMDDNKKHE